MSEAEDATQLISMAHELITGFRTGNSPSCPGPFDEMQNSHVSIRNLVRVVAIAAYFMDIAPKWLFRKDELKDVWEEPMPRVLRLDIHRRAVLLAVCCSYYFLLPEQKVGEEGVSLRAIFEQKMEASEVLKRWWGEDFILRMFVDTQVNAVFDRLVVFCKPEHAHTRPLKEHMFAITVCSQLKIPVLITGPPGSSKTLAYQLVSAGLKSRAEADKVCVSSCVYVVVYVFMCVVVCVWFNLILPN